MTMLSKYITKSEDLVTSREITKKGFLEQSIKKAEVASPYIERAKEFLKALKGVSTTKEIVDLSTFQDELLAAASFSEKASNYFSKQERKEFIRKTTKKLLEEDGLIKTI